MHGQAQGRAGRREGSQRNSEKSQQQGMGLDHQEDWGPWAWRSRSEPELSPGQ
jgi:hypothetical protein